jgi:hypothetical protein
LTDLSRSIIIPAGAEVNAALPEHFSQASKFALICIPDGLNNIVYI